MAVRERQPANLPTEEWNRRTHEHLDGFFAEMKGAAGVARDRYNPLTLARRHPIATGVVVGVAALLVARMVFHRRPATPPPERRDGPGPTFGGSLLAGMGGALGRILPQLLLMYLARRATDKTGEPAER